MGQRTERRPPLDLAGEIPILSGGDGFRAFCTLCIEPVSPGPWARATLQAALADRMNHQRNCPKGAL